MADVWFNSALFDGLTGAIDYNSDTIHALLTSSAYTPDKDAHAKRSDVTNEISGGGYTAGGAAVTVTVTQDNTNDRIDILLGGHEWIAGTGVTLTVRRVVYCKWRSGAASADELIAAIDFGADVIASNGGSLTLTASTLRIQN